MIFNILQAHNLKKQILPHMTFLENIFGSKKIDNWIARWIWSIFW
jgi:hypothetical protein